MNRNWMISGVAAVAVTGMVGVSAQAAHVDTFGDGEFTLDVNTVGQTDSISQNGLDQSAVLGGSREVSLTYDRSDAAPEDGVSARVRPNAGTADPASDGRLSFSAGAGEVGTLELSYGFDDVGGSMDIASNSSGADYDGFRFNFTQADAGTDFNVTALDTNGDSDTESQTTTPGASNLVFDYADFGGVDFQNIDQIVVEINGAQSGDYTLAGFTRTEGQSVPTPAALPAGMLMLGGLLLNRRRRKQA